MSRLVSALVLLLLAAACNSSGGTQPVSREDFGDEWPLTIDSGTLSCENLGAATDIGTSRERLAVYFTSDDGRRYAVNGSAMGVGDAPAARDTINAKETPYPDDPSIVINKDLGELIQMGLDLC